MRQYMLQNSTPASSEGREAEESDDISEVEVVDCGDELDDKGNKVVLQSCDNCSEVVQQVDQHGPGRNITVNASVQIKRLQGTHSVSEKNVAARV